MLDLTPEQLNTVKLISSQYLAPATEIYAFGSRTNGKARKYSDLDLLIKSDKAIPYQTLTELENAFSESDLPFMTDIIDWQQISEEFRAAISKELVKLS
ncbi:nucleotidyltransferase family protein [Neptunomonas sp.]|uniref:nucleotidyltransferase family protein n=1 Tax=Neptunomonas sp. TaxID=1971898 RepID=UPI003566460A